MKTEISVIVPVYNVEKYLSDCLDSILHQTFGDLELILIDDGSTDGSGRICDEYAGADARIRVLHIENGGPGNARNRGLEIARGEYIGFVDSDDWIDPDTYASMHGRAVESGADLVLCDYRMETPKGSFPDVSCTRTGKYFDRKEIETAFLPYFFGYSDDELKNFRNYCPFADYHSYTVLGLFRASVIRENGICFRSERVYFNEDNLFNLEFLLRASSVSHLPKPFYHYRCNGASVSQSFHQRYREMKEEKYHFLSSLIESEALGEAFFKRLENKIAIEAVSIVNYYASSRLSAAEKRKRVAAAAESPMLSGPIRNIPLMKLKPSRISLYLLLLRLRWYHAIVAFSGLYQRLRG